jgi:FixJ family two-component response regulator
MDERTVLPVSGPAIIVVDDDAAVRGSLKFSLEIEGFLVRTYPNADALLKAEPDAQCACLIVDQNMPGMTGLQLVATLRSRGNAAPAILVCGHTSAMLRHEAAQASVPVVEKPFLGNVLIEQIRSAIANGQG